MQLVIPYIYHIPDSNSKRGKYSIFKVEVVEIWEINPAEAVEACVEV